MDKMNYEYLISFWTWSNEKIVDNSPTIIKVSDEVYNGLCKVNTLGGFTTILIGFPILGTFTSITCSCTAAYALARNIHRLIEKKNNNESISLTDSEARWIWFAFGCNAIGTTTSYVSDIIRNQVNKKEEVSTGLQISYNILSGVNWFLGSPTGLIISTYDVVKNREYIDKKNLFDYARTWMHFYNSFGYFQTANNLISQSKNEAYKNDEDYLSTKRKLYKLIFFFV